jgi:glycosyltransferase involved in cell wall biosynthesis
MKISVVVPVYGCRNALNELYKRLTNVLTKITKDYEIIFVNDNCPQNSFEVMEQICKKDKRVVGIELSRNFGQMKAILAGLDHSKGEYVVVMDCDLQDRPEEIENLYNKVLEGYDVVFARRKVRQDSFLKVLMSKMFYKIYSIATDIKYDASICNFSISKRIVIDNYCKMREQHRTFAIYIKWLGFKQVTIDVSHDKRKEGKSSYNFKKRLKLALDILFSQSDKLLKTIVYSGFCITIISFIAVIWIILNYLFNSVSSGWSSIIATICLMSGVIIFVIGVVGIYIGNIFVQVKERPLYVVRSVLNDRKQEKK